MAREPEPPRRQLIRHDPVASRDLYLRSLDNLTAVDGREVLYSADLRPFLSEGALHRNRAFVQVEWLIKVSESGFPDAPSISDDEKTVLRGIAADFDPKHAAEYDHFGRNGTLATEHDVKSVEFGVDEQLDNFGLGRLKEWVHFPFTSEDLNNIAWNIGVRNAINHVVLPQHLAVMDRLAGLSEQYAGSPSKGITHYQDATPTTVGKRFSHHLFMLSKEIDDMSNLTLGAKINGPTGNNNAVKFVEPGFDYAALAREFIEGMGFKYIENTNQRNDHQQMVDLLNKIKNINVIEEGLSEELGLGILLKWYHQVAIPGQVGSSVMPHKVNPWRLEVARGYFEQSSSMIDGSTRGLIQTAFERDASDHPWERSYGDMMARNLIGAAYLEESLDMLEVDEQKVLRDLQDTPEVLSEAVQIAGRKLGVEGVYTIIKDETRDKEVDLTTIRDIIDRRIPAGELKDRLMELKPEDYLGDAPETARKTVEDYRKLRKNVERGILDPAKKFDAILFDFDNTLNFGDKDELQARLSEIARRLGMDFTEDEIREFGNRSDYREMRRLMVEEHTRRNSDSVLSQAEFDEIGNQVSGSLDHFFYLGDYVIEGLNKLRAEGKKLGLVSTRGPNSLPRLLKMHGLEDMFDAVVYVGRGSGNDLRPKPHPEPIAVALREMGIEDPKRAIFVGDKQTDDIIAGNALGMTTVHIGDEEPDPNGAIPDYRFPNLQPLINRFARS